MGETRRAHWRKLRIGAGTYVVGNVYSAIELRSPRQQAMRRFRGIRKRAVRDGAIGYPLTAIESIGLFAELVRGSHREVFSIMALTQLARKVADGSVDHATTLHGRSLKQRIGPAPHVLVVAHAQELCGIVGPAFDQPSVPRKDGHVRDRISTAGDEL